MRPWLKAGLLGGIVLAGFTTLSEIMHLLPGGAGTLTTCCFCLIYLAAGAGVGTLAAHWLPRPRSTGQGAKFGALAGLVAGGFDAAYTFLLQLVLSLAGLSQAYIRAGLSPRQLQTLRESGLGFLVTPRGLLLATLCQMPISLTLCVALAALGAIVYIALAQEEKPGTAPNLAP